jgi:hypothetical protein
MCLIGINNLLGGKVQMLFGTTAVAIEHIRAAKVAEGLKWVGFAGSRTLLDHAGLVLPVALQRLRFCRRPVTPLFLRCFFSAARQHGPNLIAKRG